MYVDVVILFWKSCPNWFRVFVGVEARNLASPIGWWDCAAAHRRDREVTIADWLWLDGVVKVVPLSDVVVRAIIRLTVDELLRADISRSEKASISIAAPHVMFTTVRLSAAFVTTNYINVNSYNIHTALGQQRSNSDNTCDGQQKKQKNRRLSSEFGT